MLNIPCIGNPVIVSYLHFSLWGQESLFSKFSVGKVRFLQVAFSVCFVLFHWWVFFRYLVISGCVFFIFKNETLKRGCSVCIRRLSIGFATECCDIGPHMGHMSEYFLLGWLVYPENSSSLANSILEAKWRKTMKEVSTHIFFY